ncbi:hypothetical protein POM88_016948 [Heracleum sosnowskyi]|uniref:Uncharacterized protein n=1 Tax=Heracleum sosnowskyi TaxID=360622 RepID=A0AAD8MTG7_9APIA|nr:hypothetical protein POM88_016948 [Heracleum sosnowskyi]
MIFNSKESFNREGLGYNANSPPKREVQTPKTSKVTTPKSSLTKCLYCNVSGHTSLYCKAKEGECKVKHKCNPKGEKPKKGKETKVAQKKPNMVKNNVKQPKFHYHQKPTGFQQRNIKNQASTSTNNTRHSNVPKQGYNARNPNGHGYTHNVNAYSMPRNTSYNNDRSNQHGNDSRNAYVRNNMNYHANDHSRDSIITIFPRSNNNHVSRGNTKYMPRRNPYHISNRNQASRNDIIYVNDYPMPRFIYENSHLPYDVLTPGPSSKKGTKRFN